MPRPHRAATNPSAPRPGGESGPFGPLNRRWETIAVARRFWQGQLFWFERSSLRRAGYPPSRLAQPLKHYGKPLADLLGWWQEYLVWPGHDPDNADGYTTTDLETAIRMLMVEAFLTKDEEKRKKLRAAQRDLEEVLARSPWGDTWDLDRQTRVVDDHRNDLVASATARHPFLGDYLTRAQEQLRAEYNDLHAAGIKLAREMDEGTTPLHVRLRKMVNGWRKRNLLPREAPRPVGLHPPQ